MNKISTSNETTKICPSCKSEDVYYNGDLYEKGDTSIQEIWSCNSCGHTFYRSLDIEEFELDIGVTPGDYVNIDDLVESYLNRGYGAYYKNIRSWAMGFIAEVHVSFVGRRATILIEGSDMGHIVLAVNEFE